MLIPTLGQIIGKTTRPLLCVCTLLTEVTASQLFLLTIISEARICPLSLSVCHMSLTLGSQGVLPNIPFKLTQSIHVEHQKSCNFD